VILLLAGIGDFFTAIMTPLHAAISFVLMYAYRGWSALTGSGAGLTWVLAIMTLTVVVRSILIPLFVRQINSARNMQLIQPKMKELQDKYGADRQKLGIETQKLMKEEGVNPMASCFPMLLQMPVFFALYQVLYAAATDVPRGYFFEQNPDLVHSLFNTQFFGAQLAGHFWMADWGGFGATQIFALVLVIMMTALFFITQKQLMGKNMPPESRTGTMAQQQKMMLYLFPAMYLIMGMFIPIGVLVYWVTNNLWTLGQQWLLMRNNPTPGTPAYVEWEERMIRKGRDPEAIAAERRAKRSRKVTEAKGSRTVGTSRTPGTPGAGSGTGSRTPGGGGRTDAPRLLGGSETPDSGEDSGAAGTGGTSGVSRQQIQRQQPSRQSRSNRAEPKKKK